MSTPLVQQPINLPNPHLHRLSKIPSNYNYNTNQQFQQPPQSSFSNPTRYSRTSSYQKQPSPPQNAQHRPSIQVSPADNLVVESPSSIYSQATMASPQQYYQQNPYLPTTQPIHNRRTLSNATSTSSNSQMRRSSSNRSNNPTSYVALLRKQKATVWCDRSQAEDPRILAAQRLAKERAEREVSAGPGSAASRVTPPNSHAGSFTSGVARKIRHHGAPKAAPFAGGNLAGAGVPLRLSATEVEDDDEEQDGWNTQQGTGGKDDDWGMEASFYGSRGPEIHRRTGSGRSSNGSRLNTMNELPSASEPLGQGHGMGHGRTASEGTLGPLDEKTPLASEQQARGYFVTNDVKKDDGASPVDDKDREKQEDDLRRRGSVDDRAMTMSNVRLFVANPDLSD